MDTRTYLGLPINMERSKHNTFQIRIDKMEKSEGLKEKYVSYEGKVILIKVIAQVMLTYAMSVFKISQGLCENMEKIIKGYLVGK